MLAAPDAAPVLELERLALRHRRGPEGAPHVQNVHDPVPTVPDHPDTRDGVAGDPFRGLP